jgi:hypothetical protein
MKKFVKYYYGGFFTGLGLGATYLSYVYWRAGLFPDKAAQKEFYAWARALRK